MRSTRRRSFSRASGQASSLSGSAMVCCQTRAHGEDELGRPKRPGTWCRSAGARCGRGEADVTDEVLICTVEMGVAVPTNNRPDKLNAISPELGHAYDECMVRLASDPGVRAIVITGAGKGFCGGADAGRLATLARDGGASLASAAATPYERLTSAPAHLRQRYQVAAAVPQPVIAAVNGACVGAGLSL